MSSASSSRSRTRNTWQKQAIDEVLDQSPDFLSAQQIHQSVADAGRTVSLATVYRVLQSQVEDGVVDILALDDGQKLFRKCETTGHHHQLVCRFCRATDGFEYPIIEQSADNGVTYYVFLNVRHSIY